MKALRSDAEGAPVHLFSIAFARAKHDRRSMGRHIFFALFLMACSGSSGNDLGSNDGAVSDTLIGDKKASTDASPDVAQTQDASDAGCDVSQQNGYGVCYPTTELGTTARSGFTQVSSSGDRIANFSFTGYPATNVAPIDQGGQPPTTTKMIHLGDYFDPQQNGVAGIIGGVPIKLIHLTSADVWQAVSNEEADFISGANFTGANTADASFAAELAPLGVVFIQVLDDGPVVSTGATINDLNSWVSHHASDITSALDPENAMLGAFANSTVPFNIDIDARSMEILATATGFDSSLDQTIKNTYLPFVSNPATVKQ